MNVQCGQRLLYPDIPAFNETDILMTTSQA